MYSKKTSPKPATIKVKKATKNLKPTNPTILLKNKDKGKAIKVNLIYVLNINFILKLTFF